MDTDVYSLVEYSWIKDKSPNVPKLHLGRCLKPVKKDLAPSVINIAKNGSSSSRDDNDHHHESDSDEAYMDALDTVSRGEMSFYNCSVSGVSGFGSNMIPPGSRPDDSKMRDFMMRRFLPAAKAMTTDVPQHTLKKNVVKEKPREVKILVNTDDKKGQLIYGPNFLEDDTYDKKESEEEIADDSDSDIKALGNKSSKFCRLIPRGFCSANPVRGMCMKTRFPISPSGNKTHPSGPSSSSVSSISGSENEVWQMEWDMSGMTLATTGTDGRVRLWQSNLNGVWHEQASSHRTHHISVPHIFSNIIVPDANICIHH